MYRALYRTRRPEVFSEILGQEHIVKILKHQIEEDAVSHAYLLNGTRGTGKTSTARILAKAVNCLGSGERPCGECANCRAVAEGSFMDVIEIDAASNNGVDNIRELRESVKYPPQIGAKKVYIIDEVHMLSSGAFNALLKTLEEPPENVMFILCTTEPNKLPQTILSRCMRLDFKRIPQDAIAEDMKKICEERGVRMSEGALKLIAANADGSVRDGLSILDQVLASGAKEIEREDVLEYLGTVGDEFFIELTEMVSLRKTGEALVLLDRALAEGKDCKQLMKDWNAHYRNLLITKFMKNPEDILNMSSENISRVKSQSDYISFEEIDSAIQRISKTINDARWSTQPRILMELDIVAISGASPAGGERRRTEAFTRPSKKPTEIAEANRPERRNNEAAAEPSRTEQLAQASTNTSTERNDSAGGYEHDKKDRAGEDINASGAGEGASVSAEQEGAGCSKWDEDIDLKKFWDEVIDEGVELNGSFNLIRDWSRLESLEESVFTVSVEKEFAKKHLEEKANDIEHIVSGILERPMKISIVLSKPGEKNDKESNEEIVRITKETLGLDIIVEE